MVPGGHPCRLLPKWISCWLRRSSKIRPKKIDFLQKWSPLGSHWAPKNHKNREKCLPKAHFLLLLISVWSFYDFLTPWNLANGDLAATKHRFSLFHPTPKMSSKLLPKTLNLSTFGHRMATKCPKMGHQKIHEKSHSKQYRKSHRFAS